MRVFVLLIFQIGYYPQNNYFWRSIKTNRLKNKKPNMQKYLKKFILPVNEVTMSHGIVKILYTKK